MATLTIESAAASFFISREPAMPQIVLTAVIAGAPAPAPDAVRWTIALDYPDFIRLPKSAVRNARARSHPAIPPLTGNPVTVPFTVVTGGRLTVTATATVGGATVTATRTDILIGGTNPTDADLLVAVPSRLMRQMIRQESGGAQFNDGRTGRPATAINPNWSQDNLRGVGLGQLTVPAPSDDETWNWKTNAAALQTRYQAKRRPGATLHTRIMGSRRFATEVQALNDWRRAEGQPPLTVTMPALTADEQDREGLRAYNGFGRKVAGQYLDYIHEYEPARAPLTSATRRDAAGKPLTSPPLLSVDARGQGSWRQVSGDERNTRSGGRAPGDPHYVENVLGRQG